MQSYPQASPIFIQNTHQHSPIFDLSTFCGKLVDKFVSILCMTCEFRKFPFCNKDFDTGIFSGFIHNVSFFATF